MHKNLNKKRGFTLIELLVVIAILALLTSIVLSALNDARQKAVNSGVIQSAIELRKAIELYYSDNGQYPGEDNAPGGYYNVQGSYSYNKYPSSFDLRDELEDYISRESILKSSITGQKYWYYSNVGIRVRCFTDLDDDGVDDNPDGPFPKYIIMLESVGGFETDLPGVVYNDNSSFGGSFDTYYCIPGQTN